MHIFYTIIRVKTHFATAKQNLISLQAKMVKNYVSHTSEPDETFSLDGGDSKMEVLKAEVL
jgi:hypothetical protein